MSSLEEYRLKLLARNEGKLKSHESCFDIRAWSHDIGARDRYLREWIKCDMPFCVMPLSTLVCFLRNMTCCNRRRATPRCHRDCKSKAILESICVSCHAMRECLKSDENFEKFFIEEELETTRWPCERCLEALKSIKMFWKIIIEKIFNLNVPKNDAKVHIGCCRTNSIRDVAKMWERDMVQQAMFVKSATAPRLSNCPSNCTLKSPSRKGTCCRITKRCSEGDRGSVISHKTSRITIPSKKICQNPKCAKNRITVVDRESSCNSQPCVVTPKICRCTSVRVKSFDVGCNTIVRRDCDEVRAYKTNLEYLQKNYNEQKEELDKLKRENTSLRIELQNVYKNGKWKTPFFCSGVKHDNSNVALVPKPFECCIEESKSSGSAKDADSEMIITMKNCRNETFRHVSLLQVLHKTNDPLVKEINIGGPCYKQEDPIDLLTKVQNTLDEMVKREMSMASRRKCGQTSDIKATYQRLNSCKSEPSCSTIPSRCALG